MARHPTAIHTLAESLRQFPFFSGRRDADGEARLYVQRALTAAAEERYDVALVFCEKALAAAPSNLAARLLVGRILARYEERGLKLVGLKLMTVDRELAERHYAVHREKPFFRGLVDFITSGPLVAAVLEGPNAIAIVRAMNGATRPGRLRDSLPRGSM